MKLTEWTMEEQEQLIHFMTTNTWPYHGNAHPARELIEKTIEEGGYQSDEVKTFWVENEDGKQVGIVKIYDLRDEIPLFDLRIADEARGRGYGPRALKMVAEYIFQLPEAKIRLEGHTRQDNFAMRKTFERAGFVKEAQLRQAWFSPKEESYYDAVTYGMTREDFLKGTSTPVKWDDDSHPEVSKKEDYSFSEELHTERLIIRAPKVEDADVVWKAIVSSHEALKEWMPWAQTKQTLEQTTANLRQAVADFITRKDLRLHLFSKETGEFVGSSGLHRIDWNVRKFEIGYWIDSKFEGKGLMTEAVERITEFAFEELQANRVEIRCDSENVRSRSVAARLAYTLEGTLRHDSLSADNKKLRDTCIYAKIKE
ncbi:GNAT family N-acetyltransferase [Psychrobacillus sp. NEAU-3TGS]|uniref:GNAT family N-acetyltransferase n=1 Tax=Psychrobacillus sp. NEAU-3TGS TaxID=2995412 RepID=UPI002496395B|nr:GNAT family N-acetyltransferase [Psychrobacillus sp. NEAU-3TGS]MDI2586004.1 GNAT family N-acetyltransferase [Psychrobacillus sp. NEAU-3TGS]